MFDKKVQAQAVILEDEGPGNVEDTDMHGVHWDHHKYIVEVRPEGEAPFRVETKAKVPIRSAPHPGDVVTVTYEPKNHKAEIQIAGDPRYDPKLVGAAKKEQAEARREALLSGATVPGAQRVVDDDADEIDDEPRWVVPAMCPECGARVDQSTASTAAHPKCEFCSQPLPCEPIL